MRFCRCKKSNPCSFDKKLFNEILTTSMPTLDPDMVGLDCIKVTINRYKIIHALCLLHPPTVIQLKIWKYWTNLHKFQKK